MKFTYRQLRKDIDTGDIRPVYFFYGPEEFLKEQAVQDIARKLVPKNLRDFNVDILYGDETDASSILDRVASLPMMAQRRVVLVRNVHQMPAEERRKILEYSASSEKRRRLAELEAVILKKEKEVRSDKKENVPEGQDPGGGMKALLKERTQIVRSLQFAFPHACLLLTAEDQDVRKMFYRGGKKTKAAGKRPVAWGRKIPPGTEWDGAPFSPWLNDYVDRVVCNVKFSSLAEREIPHWIRRLAQKYGKKIHPQAVELLTKAIGGDLLALDNELAKLSIYVEGRPEIGPGDVEMVVGELRVRTVFDLGDVILGGDLVRSMSLLGHLMEAGITSQQFTGALRWILIRRPQARSVGRKTAIRPEGDRLEQAFGLLFQTELKVNTGWQSARTAMTLLTYRLCRLFGADPKGSRGAP